MAEGLPTVRWVLYLAGVIPLLWFVVMTPIYMSLRGAGFLEAALATAGSIIYAILFVVGFAIFHGLQTLVLIAVIAVILGAVFFVRRRRAEGKIREVAAGRGGRRGKWKRLRGAGVRRMAKGLQLKKWGTRLLLILMALWIGVLTPMYMHQGASLWDALFWDFAAILYLVFYVFGLLIFRYYVQTLTIAGAAVCVATFLAWHREHGRSTK